MFNVLIPQALYSLSGGAAEFHRCAFMRRIGLGLHEAVPDAKMIWLLCEQLKRSRGCSVTSTRCSVRLANHRNRREAGAHDWPGASKGEDRDSEPRLYMSRFAHLQRMAVSPAVSSMSRADSVRPRPNDAATHRPRTKGCQFSALDAAGSRQRPRHPSLASVGIDCLRRLILYPTCPAKRRWRWNSAANSS